MKNSVGSPPRLRKQRRTVYMTLNDFTKWLPFIIDKSESREVANSYYNSANKLAYMCVSH